MRNALATKCQQRPVAQSKYNPQKNYVFAD